MRLARTEINMAYRTAEQTRWKQFDFVVGYEVKTTQNGHHVEDICDLLAGKYPKDFVFKGWHPQCMCYAIPILKTEEEFWADDSENSTESVNEVTDLPDNFKEWIRDNEERIEKATERGTLPYFIKDNQKQVAEIFADSTTVVDNDFKSAEELARIESNRKEYERLKADPNYKDVEFNPANGGLKATHVEHNFDGRTGWYERSVQEVGFNFGNSIILEEEIHSIQNKKNVEGTFNSLPFEIAGAETGIPNNIRNALKHCASKPNCKVAVVFYPDETKVDMKSIREGLKKYYGLRNDPKQFNDFQAIYIITPTK